MRLAVTGITGTIGQALAAVAAAEPRVDTVVGLSSRGGGRGDLPGVELLEADVRDQAALERAFADADVVVHLAFSLYGVHQGLRELEDVNVGGTVNAYRAARAAGVPRFVQASSVAAYGLQHDRPRRYVEADPVRPDPRHFYVEHKARAELALRELVAEGDGPELVLLRPCGIAGPNAAGAAAHGLDGVSAAAVGLLRALYAAGLRAPVPAPSVEMQFLHESDAAAAFLRAALDAPAGTYNLAPPGTIDGPDALRALGISPLPLPRVARDRLLAAVAALPLPLPVLSWAHLLRFPLTVDGSAGHAALGWRPSMDSAAALRATAAAWARV